MFPTLAYKRELIFLQDAVCIFQTHLRVDLSWDVFMPLQTSVCWSVGIGARFSVGARHPEPRGNGVPSATSPSSGSGNERGTQETLLAISFLLVSISLLFHAD